VCPGVGHMPGDPKECREHAKHCFALAAKITNPTLRESFLETARRVRLAAEVETANCLLAEWGTETVKVVNPV
jgi:hypothetical protein